VELFSLICFADLAETSSFTESSNRLHLSQSAFSKRISALEREVGAALFLRESRGVSLTPSGRAMLENAVNIRKELYRMEGELRQYRKSSERALSVHTHSLLTPYGLSVMLMRFERRHPEFSIVIREFESTSAIDACKKDMSAVGIIFSDSKNLPNGFKSIPLIHDELVVVADAGHPLSKFASVPLLELGLSQLQLLPRVFEPILFDFIVTQCQKAGFTPRYRSPGLWFDSMQDMLLGSGEIGVLPRKVAMHNRPSGLALIPISGASKITISFIVHEENHLAAARALTQFAVSTRAEL
jgi:DNA-binding transcriptional LysR family regulator